LNAGWREDGGSDEAIAPCGDWHGGPTAAGWTMHEIQQGDIGAGRGVRDLREMFDGGDDDVLAMFVSASATSPRGERR